MTDLFTEDPPSWAIWPEMGDYGSQCGACGAWMEIVRPGKSQCINDDCEVNDERQRALEEIIELGEEMKTEGR